MGLEFGDVQNEIKPHFVVLILFATLFTTGVTLYMIEFVKHGLPNDEAVISNQTDNSIKL